MESALIRPQNTMSAIFRQIKPAVPLVPAQPLFDNPFVMDDLLVFDHSTLGQLLDLQAFGLQPSDLALSLHGNTGPLSQRITESLSEEARLQFNQILNRPASVREVEAARRKVLDSLFWELTYWKTPDLYEELTEGEKLHPGIFKQLEPVLKNKTVLDAGAGSGRASFECVSQGAGQVYAVEPSPGLLNILKRKAQQQSNPASIVPLQGRFERIPLEDNSVDVALSCSAFTADPGQGGLPGLAELKRVTKSGGQIIIIWPRQEDRAWLRQQGFNYKSLPMEQEMRVRFRSLESAVRCAKRFYAHNRAVMSHLIKSRRPEVPFSVLGFNPPHEYCWLKV